MSSSENHYNANTAIMETLFVSLYYKNIWILSISWMNNCLPSTNINIYYYGMRYGLKPTHITHDALMYTKKDYRGLFWESSGIYF